MYRGQHRPRPVEAVAEEIERAPGRHVYFCDDENFIDESFAAELADRLEARNVRKRYFAWTRSTTVLRSPELLKRWRAIGLDTAFLGFEFVSDAELRGARKGATVAANEKALDILRSYGIAVHAAFMIRPQWGEDDFHELESYVRGLPPVQCSFTVCTPSPGTPDYEAMRSDVWVDAPYDLHDCMHPLTPTKLPLRRFSECYARLVRRGTERTPMRVAAPLARPQDLARVLVAEARYRRAFRTIHRDYPRDLQAAASW
jgi:hypothetical protein